ncbi:GTP-dependent dephospho-CoA kinase family protein [Candidatus Bathyarchaeota archaeon]|nr:GTP-dependent dephospho-CoA kinase family protein [Candidatus Bathyarchaeota archaeon]
MLKKPLGKLLAGSQTEVDQKLKKLALEKPRKIICVGDAVSRKFMKLGLPTNVKVIDNKEMRRKVEPFDFKAKTIFKVRNPKGSIELAAWQAIKDAVKKDDVLMIVDGEEDLLALPMIISAPEDSLIFYGQPKTGVVSIKVNKEKKSEAKKIISMMKVE